jgi:hypothetical protein
MREIAIAKRWCGGALRFAPLDGILALSKATSLVK